MRKITPDKIRLMLYLFTFAAILFYPVSKIISAEFPAKEPTVYTFEVSLYDPYDPVRGRYVQLGFDMYGEAAVAELPEMKNALSSYSKCYAVLEKDKDGKTVVTDLCVSTAEIPAGKDFLRVEYLYPDKCGNGKRHYIRYPFQYFYLNEKIAPEAEKLLQTRNQNAQLKVKVYENGKFAVDDLYINGKSIRAALRAE